MISVIRWYPSAATGNQMKCTVKLSLGLNWLGKHFWPQQIYIKEFLHIISLKDVLYLRNIMHVTSSFPLTLTK